MPYTIHYYSEDVEAKVLALPKTLLARYFNLTDRMITALQPGRAAYQGFWQRPV